MQDGITSLRVANDPVAIHAMEEVYSKNLSDQLYLCILFKYGDPLYGIEL